MRHFFKKAFKNKRILCAFIMCISAWICLAFSIPQISSRDWQEFLIPCMVAGIVVGSLVLPPFISNKGSPWLRYGSAIAGGVLSPMAAFPLVILVLFGYQPFVEDFAETFEFFLLASALGAFSSSLHYMPIGILGALVAQMIWQRIGEQN